MPRCLALAVFLLLTPVAASAGGFGSDAPPSRIPVPAKEFSASVEDRSGVVLDVSTITFNGEVFLYGTIGKAQVTLPFESLISVSFVDSALEKKRKAVAVTTDGESIEIYVEDDLPCYGRTTFGNYRIEVEDLRRVVINR